MTEHESLVFKFDDVEVREREFLLIKAGEAHAVEPKAFRVLLFLLRNPGRLLTKDEILDTVWNDCEVSENSLTRSIAMLRRLLGDDTHEPRYIATVPTVGYRFLCDVQVTTDGRVALPASPDPVSSPAEPALAGASTGMRLRWLRISLIAISLVAVGATVFWFLKARPATNHPPTEQRITSNSPEAAIRSAVISPDGKYLAFSDPTGLYLRVIATGETRRWTLPKDFIANPTSWFPDGTNMLVTRFEGPMQTPSLWKISLLGASPRKVMDKASAGSVSLDGSRIAFLTVQNPRSARGRELWIMRTDGSNPHKIADASQTGKFSYIFAFVWSPNGQHIAYTEGHQVASSFPRDDFLFTLRTCDADGGDLQVVLDDNRLRWPLAWAPDGRILFAYRQDPTSDRIDEGVGSIRVDPHTAKATGPPQFLTHGSGSITTMSVDSDGSSWRWVQRSSGGSNLVRRRIIRAPNSESRPILQRRPSDLLVISPDGKYLAYSDPTGLYLRHVATGEIRRWPVPKEFIARANSWFPDGTHLLVTRSEGPMQTPSLWKISMLGASPRKLIDNATPGLVSPDG